MKFVSIPSLILIFALLSACGQQPAPAAEATPTPTEAPTPEPTETPTPSPTAIPTPTPEPTPEPTEEPTPEPTTEPQPEAAPIVIRDDEVYYQEAVYEAKHIYEVIESGVIRYQIDSFGAFRMIVHDSDFAERLDVPVETEFTLFALFTTVENTSDGDVFFSQHIDLTTNTKQQVTQNWYLSDILDPNYYGNVEKEIEDFFILDKTIAEDLESVTVRLDAPSDLDSYDDLGEEIRFTLNFADYTNEVG